MYPSEEDKVLCEKCGTYLQIGCFPFCKGDPADHGYMSYQKNATFPFTVNHVDGKPMVIESLNHLRRVEKDYGVVFSAFSKNNINDMDPVDRELPRYRGDDEDTRGRYRR